MSEHSETSAKRTRADDEIDLLELVGVLRSGKWRIALSILLALLLALAYLWVATPIYRADVLLQVEERGAGVLDELPSLLGEEAGASTEIEVLRSRSIVGEVVRQLELDVVAQPNYVPVIGRAFALRSGSELAEPPVEFLKSYAWGGEKIEVERFEVASGFQGRVFKLVVGSGSTFELIDPNGNKLGVGEINKRFSADSGKLQLFVSQLVARPGTEFTLLRRRYAQAVSGLQNRLSISEKGRKTGVISAALEGAKPARIQATLQALANEYVRQNVERVSAEAQKSLEFLDSQLPKLKSELEASEANLTAYRQQSNAADLTLETKSVLDKLVTIESELRSLQLRRDELLQRFASQHPSVLVLDEQEQSLRADIESLKSKIDVLPQTQQDVLRLSRNTQVNAELYTFLLNKTQELRVVKAGTVGNVRILDSALEPYKPIKPRKSIVTLGAMMLGGVLGVGWVLLRKAMRRAIVSPQQVEDAVGLPIFAVVPHSDVEKSALPKRARGKQHMKMPLLGMVDPKDPAFEAIRSLRTSLHFALMDAANKHVVITGPSPGIGKSFLSTNLGLALSQADNKVVVVDADMRKGHVNRYFDCPRNPGLSELLSGSKNLDEVVVPMPDQPMLHLVPTGELPPNPSELLLTPRWAELLSELDEIYDIIVIDTPPVMAVTDASIAAQGAAATFIVTRYGVNTPAELQATVARLKNNNVDVSGIVFNGLEKSSIGNGRYDQYAYYHYSYK